VNRRLYAVDAALGRAIQNRPKIVRFDGRRGRGVGRAVRNAFDNLDEPSTAANDLMQRKVASAGRTAVRFVINSTVGVVGLFDVAERVGLTKHTNTLDKTLAAYGAPAGPYVYIPIAGPATLRAAFSLAAESYLYPPHWLHLAAGVAPVVTGAGYAKLAVKVVRHADGGDRTPASQDAYAQTRRAYYAAQSKPAPATAQSPSGGERPTALASIADKE
jgi:phospholipid-binding lipoprotein MlaA